MTVERAKEAINDLIVRLGKNVQAALRDTGAFHQREMVKRFVPYGSGDPIQTRSGSLRRSFGFEQRGTGLTLFSTGLPYIRIQEYGGVVRPKNKRYLTVPLPDALTASGVLRGGARLLKSGDRYQTADGEPTFIFRSKRGNLLVATRQSRKLLYVLRTSVRLKPRLGFRQTFARLTQPYMVRRLKEGIRA